MKHIFQIGPLILLAILPSVAQMAVSHEPTSYFAASVPSAASMTKPVARVNGTVLTENDLQREMYAIFPDARVHNGIPKAMEPQIRKGALQMIVFEELVYQEAERRHTTIAPARMQKAVADFRKQFKTPDEYRQFMKEEMGGSQQMLRGRIRRALLIDTLLNSDVTTKATVSLAEAKAFYDKNADTFRLPESFSLQTISIVPPANARPDQLKEARKRAERACQQAKATKNYEQFGALAERISEDDFRVMMGDHKLVDRAKLPPAILQAALRMQPGEVSDLIQVEQWYTVFRLNAHQAAGMQKFADVKDSIRKQLEQQKTEALRSQLNRQLRAKAKVEVL